MANKFFERLANALLKSGAMALIDRVFKKEGHDAPQAPPPSSPTPRQKTHPWRLCPVGEHWVRPHPLRVPKSDKHPDGVTTRDTDCRNNPVRGKKKIAIKDYLHPHEIHAIAEGRFKDLTGPPAVGKLPYENSDKYDALIRGWTKYWNEVFQPKDLLDPDLVKALIGSESGFRLNPPKQNAGIAGKANGLIQLTDQAIKALQNPDGELRDRLVKMSSEDASDPNIAICAGIRWLYHKKAQASHDLKREATWLEGIAKYKSYLKDMRSRKKPDPEGMKKIREDYGKLKQ